MVKGVQAHGDRRRSDVGWWAHNAINIQVMYHGIVHLKPI